MSISSNKPEPLDRALDRSADTRARILKAALREFSSSGLAGAYKCDGRAFRHEVEGSAAVHDKRWERVVREHGNRFVSERRQGKGTTDRSPRSAKKPNMPAIK